MTPYHQYAQEYDAWFDSHQTEYALELEAIRALLPKKGHGIEIGAGTGRFAAPLQMNLAVEPAEAMREIAISRGINIVAGAAESLPVADKSFNYALMVTVVCFLNNPATAFKEAHRILNNRGSLLIGFIDNQSPLGKLYEQKKKSSKFYQNARFRSVKEMEQLLAAAGFGDLSYSQAIFPADIVDLDAPCVKPGHGQGSFVVIRALKTP